MFSVIRKKFKKYANEYVSKSQGPNCALFLCSDENHLNCNCEEKYSVKDSTCKLSNMELLVLKYLRKDFTIKEISKVMGKSEHSIRKMKQRLNKKLVVPLISQNRSIKKIDTSKTMVKIDKDNFHKALQRTCLTHQDVIKMTGITNESLKDMMEKGLTSYHNLFLLMDYIKFNPYGPSEKEELTEILSDPNLISSIRNAEKEERSSYKSIRSKLIKEKMKYRNSVMYYGTSCLRHKNNNLEQPYLENGRNGLFPLVLTKQQQAKCGWLLKKFMLRPVYTYKCRGLTRDIKLLEKKLLNEERSELVDKYKRELVFLKESAALEDGKSIYIIGQDHFNEIKRTLKNHES